MSRFGARVVRPSYQVRDLESEHVRNPGQILQTLDSLIVPSSFILNSVVSNDGDAFSFSVGPKSNESTLHLVSNKLVQEGETRSGGRKFTHEKFYMQGTRCFADASGVSYIFKGPSQEEAKINDVISFKVNFLKANTKLCRDQVTFVCKLRSAFNGKPFPFAGVTILFQEMSFVNGECFKIPEYHKGVPVGVLFNSTSNKATWNPVSMDQIPVAPSVHAFSAVAIEGENTFNTNLGRVINHHTLQARTPCGPKWAPHVALAMFEDIVAVYDATRTDGKLDGYMCTDVRLENFMVSQAVLPRQQNILRQSNIKIKATTPHMSILLCDFSSFAQPDALARPRRQLPQQQFGLMNKARLATWSLISFQLGLCLIEASFTDEQKDEREQFQAVVRCEAGALPDYEVTFLETLVGEWGETHEEPLVKLAYSLMDFDPKKEKEQRFGPNQMTGVLANEIPKVKTAAHVFDAFRAYFNSDKTQQIIPEVLSLERTTEPEVIGLTTPDEDDDAEDSTHDVSHLDMFPIYEPWPEELREATGASLAFSAALEDALRDSTEPEDTGVTTPDEDSTVFEFEELNAATGADNNNGTQTLDPNGFGEMFK